MIKVYYQHEETGNTFYRYYLNEKGIEQFPRYFEYKREEIIKGEEGKDMGLGKFPISFSTRLKQFFCNHETMSKGAYAHGINAREGYNYVVYRCGKCSLCIEKWEKKEDW